MLEALLTKYGKSVKVLHISVKEYYYCKLLRYQMYAFKKIETVLLVSFIILQPQFEECKNPILVTFLECHCVNIGSGKFLEFCCFWWTNLKFQARFLNIMAQRNSVNQSRSNFSFYKYIWVNSFQKWFQPLFKYWLYNTANRFNSLICMFSIYCGKRTLEFICGNESNETKSSGIITSILCIPFQTNYWNN